MNKRRLIITSVLSIFLSAVLLIGSTYSIFTSQEIDETANVYKTGNLSVTYKTSGNIQADPIPKNEDEADAVIPYRITITNTGNVPYQFNVILTDTTSSTDNTIDYQYIMTKVGYLDTKPLSECTNNIIKEDVILLAGEAVDIDIRVWISDTVPNSELGKSFYAKLTIDGQAVYNDSKEINNDMLSLNYMTTSSTSNFRSDTYTTYIKTASFVDYIDTSNASIDTTTNEVISWNMSADTNKPNSIVAWLEDNGTMDDSGNKYYDLYIGSRENIYAKSLATYFLGMTSLVNISFDNLDTSLTTEFGKWQGGMFQNCSNLTGLDVSNFDTSNVTSMVFMFRNCSNLESLDLSGWNTSNVTSMVYMFQNCSNLESLDLSGWNTSNVTSMASMFENCSNLESLDLSGWNTSKVTSMNAMFYGCSLTKLDLSHFDTSNVADMLNMFYGCKNLRTTLVIRNVNTSYYNSTNGNSMFIYGFTNGGSSLTLDYTNETESLVDEMVEYANKSNIVKGICVDC